MRVYVASPYRGATDAERCRNVAYAEAAIEDVLRAGDAPFAPHLLYPRVLDDSIPEDRVACIAAGLAWLAVCDEMRVYQDIGISAGMRDEVAAAQSMGKPVVYVSLDGWRVWPHGVPPLPNQCGPL